METNFVDKYKCFLDIQKCHSCVSAGNVGKIKIAFSTFSFTLANILYYMSFHISDYYNYYYYYYYNNNHCYIIDFTYIIFRLGLVIIIEFMLMKFTYCGGINKFFKAIVASSYQKNTILSFAHLSVVFNGKH